MPGGDGMGPLGEGARTGRGAGRCAGFGFAGYAGRSFGIGRGMSPGRGRGKWPQGLGGGGRGWRNLYYATGLPGWARGGIGTGAQPTEEDLLDRQAQSLQEELDRVKMRLGELRAQSAKDREP